MKLKLQNIGIIEEADINIDGITLIAGQNDSGKSTVGKVLYALIRGVNIDEDRFNASKNEFVRNRIRDVRNLLLRTKLSNSEDEKIREKFVSEFLENPESLFGRYIYRMNTDDSEKLDTLISELDNLNKLYNSFSNVSIKTQLGTFINDITNRISISIDSNEVLHYELESFFDNEFGNQIKNKFKKGNSYINIEGIKEKKITFEEPIHFEGFNSMSNFYYDEVFFIESPIKLEDRNLLRFNNILRDKNQYLNSKIFEPNKEQDIFSDRSNDTEKLNLIISDIIKGAFEFNSKNQLIFKKNEIEFDLNNVATGIKSFGILQLLLQKGKLNSNSLLIIDEPEVHLHPTWQVKYAEILVRLSKEFAIPILLTSHSPYFIEALEGFSKKHDYEKSTNFYFAEKNEDGLSSKIVDVTENISPILSSISEAFYEIQDINYED
ncbi:AAA family ATPase [Flavobacterium psychrophilum]|nr:AAA family ATPase [Flavobacterium psychrophilum]ELM3649443.1 AAA family ATPase [Flavobacterium psychrophilum]ELM3671213.1 AAA family ATPase [Flavobacterium psychrophilum]ELM3725004.1 AAA family ATPase [Flavobacterium psychrophilum]ELY1978249.1 AAA family ATPase [Flavobacterium psychrophilum]